MKLDLIEIKPKNYKRKVFIAIVISILFIIAFSFLGIKVAEAYNKKIIAKRNEISVSKKNHENNKQEENKQTRQDNIENINSSEEAIENMNSNKLPVYSENAKKKLKSLYTDDTKVAYLTFDDGPTKNITPKILDILKEENVKATFFVVGKNVDSYPEIVKRAYDEGHFIANHGYDHNNKNLYKNDESFLNEIEKTDIAIGNVVGSCLFNLLFILGISSSICPYSFEMVLYIDAIIMTAVIILLYVIALVFKKVDKKQAILFVILFIIYMIYIIYRN